MVDPMKFMPEHKIKIIVYYGAKKVSTFSPKAHSMCNLATF
jgi:hypothetical protein